MGQTRPIHQNKKVGISTNYLFSNFYNLQSNEIKNGEASFSIKLDKYQENLKNYRYGIGKI